MFLVPVTQKADRPPGNHCAILPPPLSLSYPFALCFQDRVKAIIESFGGRVTGSVSGQTSYVVVGKDPGATKVKAARERGIPTPDLLSLKSTVETPGASLEDAPAARITSFSKGYKGNGKGALMDVEVRSRKARRPRRSLRRRKCCGVTLNPLPPSHAAFRIRHARCWNLHASHGQECT